MSTVVLDRKFAKRTMPLETSEANEAAGTSQPENSDAARMGPLAKLPVFLDLAGKRAVVAGGTAAATWKAELLAATGAHVEIYANSLSSEMKALISRGAAAGTIAHKGDAWSPEIFSGAAIALADAEDDTEAASFSQAARGAGVLCNVIDKPRFCQFQFGSIVNRSPIVVGISTDGTAPILGQAIRRRIEVLLPPSLAEWGKVAKVLRSSVKKSMPLGPRRRAFWERFVERAFGAAPTAEAIRELETAVGEIAASAQAGRGKLTVVGAGPGEVELLTLKAVRVLQAADVVLYDTGISDGVLELARREAERIPVNMPLTPGGQHDFAQRILKFAQDAKNVVHVSLGGPADSAAASDTIELLSSQGVPIEIVPGITLTAATAG